MDIINSRKITSIMKIERILSRIGLNDKQVKVYLACLELGSASVNKISNKAGLVRTTVYEILEALNRKQFVNFFLNRGVKYYSAENPEKIIRQIEDNATSLKNILPELRALDGSARHRPAVRFYQGKDGIKLIMEEILREAKELISFGSADDLFREMGDYHQTFLTKRVKNKIPLRVILRDTSKGRERKKLETQHLRQVKLLKGETEFNGLIFIWGNKIAMFSFKHDLIGIVISSDVLAETQRQMFNAIWGGIE